MVIKEKRTPWLYVDTLSGYFNKIDNYVEIKLQKILHPMYIETVLVKFFQIYSI